MASTLHCGSPPASVPLLSMEIDMEMKEASSAIGGAERCIHGNSFMQPRQEGQIIPVFSEGSRRDHVLVGFISTSTE